MPKPGKREDVDLAGGEWINDVYAKTWKSAVQPPLATVVAIHGLNEHINRTGYNYAFGMLAEAGVEVHGIDLRGHGRTGYLSGDRGYTGGLQPVLKDLDEAFSRTRIPGVPFYVFGHSMGGGLALLSSLKFHEKHGISGVVVSAPAVGVHPDQKLSWPVEQIAKLLAFVLPRTPLPNKIEGHQLTSNEENAKAYFADPYVFHQQGLIVGTILPVLMGGEDLLRTSYAKWPVTLPIFALIGSKDSLCSPVSLREFITKLPAKDKKLKIYEDAVHEMVHEVDPLPAVFANDVKSWIVAHATAAKEGKALSPDGETVETVPKSVWSQARL